MLFKRKPVSFPEPSPLPEDLNTRCWHIPHTKEWFLLYEDYLARMDYYKTRKFVCEITGNSCLTYFEAHKSELREMKLVETNFPEHLKEPILRHLQFSIVPRIDQLVDEVYTTFKNDYYPGETVMIRLNDYRNDYKTRCIIREKAKFNAVFDINGNIHRPAYSQYRVARVDTGIEVVVDEAQIARDRNNFTKWFVKTFIKLSVTRSSKIGAPWIVKKKYAERYRIPTELPPHLAHYKEEVKTKDNRKLMTIRPKGEPVGKNSGRATPEAKRNGTKNAAIISRASHQAAAQVAQTPKRTVKDDLENPFELTLRKPMPQALDGFGDYVSDALESWTFLNVYRVPLILDTCTFDEFLTAMRWTSHQRCVLLDEIFCAAISLFAKPGAKSLDGFIPEEIEDYGDDEINTAEEVKKENGTDKKDSKKTEEEEQEENSYEDTDRVDEYITYRNQSYVDRLSKRAFKDGGWQIVLLGVLDEVRHFKEWKNDIKTIFEELAPLDSAVTPNALLGRFLDLAPGYRVRALNILCSLVANSPDIRLHIDKCMEDSTALRRERLDKIREYKISFEKAQDIDKELRVIHESRSALPLSTEAMAAEVQEQESKKRRRRAGIKVDPTDSEMKFAEENEKFASLLAARTAQLKLAEDMRSQRRSLEKQIVEIDVQRIKCLGKDRLFNRYWWFENNGLPKLGGRKHTDDDEDDLEEVDDEDDDEDIHNETYLMGRLWVQGPSDEDTLRRLELKKDLVQAWKNVTEDDAEEEEKPKEEQKEEIKDGNATEEEIIPPIFKGITPEFIKNADELFHIKFDVEDRKVKSSLDGHILVDEYGATATGITALQRKIIEEHPDPLLSADDWRYYDNPDDIEKLLEWFDLWGTRESQLIKELSAVKERVTSSMASRRMALRLDNKPDDELELLKIIVNTVVSDTESEHESDTELIYASEDSDGRSSDVEMVEPDMRRTRRSIAEADKVAEERQQKEAEKERKLENARPAKRIARRETKKRKLKEHKQKRQLIESSKERLEELQEEREMQRCQDWVSTRAIEQLGHTHYEGPKRPRGRGKK